MDMTPEQAAAATIGMQLMTAWQEGDDDAGFFAAQLDTVLADAHLDEHLRLRVACTGLATVAGTLLALLAEVTGLTAGKILREVAAEYQLSGEAASERQPDPRGALWYWL